MGRINIFQFIQVGMDVQAVGGHAQEHFRISCTHLGQGFHRFVAVGKGIARTCNAHYGCVGFGLNDLCQVSHGLIRTQMEEVTPGRLSLTQSNFLLQKLHWMLQAGATGR
jgi:hypothetical protein